MRTNRRVEAGLPQELDPARRWRQVRVIFEQALDLGEGRASFLARACGSDARLRRDVDALFEAHHAAGGFIEQPLFRLSPDPPPEGSADAITVAEEDLTGQQVGPHALIRLLGQGGMGQVYLARRADAEFEKTVAVKVVRKELATPELISQFRNERQILANLEHPRIARLLDGGTTADGRPYLVMEYVEGLPVDVYCRRQELSLEGRLRLFLQICDAMSYAHRALVVHRDLKPANILVDETGTPRLLDFGIAKVLGGTDGLSRGPTGSGALTLRYASPEQLLERPVTTASDIYSLGVILYELLAGDSPYPLSASREEVWRAVCSEPPPPPSERVSASDPPRRRLRRRLRGDLDAVVLQALHKNPTRRYRAVDDLARDLERFLEHRPVAARRPRLGYVMSKWVRRHRWASAAAVLVSTSMISLLLVLALQNKTLTAERDRSRVAMETFLETLRQLDPTEGAGELTVEDVLAGGTARWADSFHRQPLLRADLLSTLAVIHTNNGRYDEAETLLTETLRLRRRLQGPEHPDIAVDLGRQGDLLLRRGDPNRAGEAFGESLEMLRTLGFDEHPRVVDSLSGLGEALARMGQLERADGWFQEALRVSQRIFALPGREQVRGVHRYARYLFERGDLPEAESAFAEALRLSRSTSGGGHLYRAEILEDAARLALSREDLGTARHHLDEAWELLRRGPRQGHPVTAGLLLRQADLVLATGDPEGAARLAREALGFRVDLLGRSHHEVAEAHLQLCRFERLGRRFDEAEAQCASAIEILRQARGSEPLSIGLALMIRAEIERLRGNYQAAGQLLLDAVDVYRKAEVEHHPVVARLYDYLSVHTLETSGDVRLAEQYHQRSVEIFQQITGAGSSALGQTYHHFARSMRNVDKLERASVLFAQALAAKQRAFGKNDPRLLRLLAVMAETELRLGNVGLAEDYARRGYQIIGAPRATVSDRDDVQAVLARCLVARGRRLEARELVVSMEPSTVFSRQVKEEILAGH